MSNTNLRFHLVDGKVNALFSNSLSGQQFAELYRFARSPITRAKCAEKIMEAAREWGLRVHLEPTPQELGILPDAVTSEKDRRPPEKPMLPRILPFAASPIPQGAVGSGS